MAGKAYVYVGNWSFESNPAKGKGITVFEYDRQQGNLKLLETVRPDVAAGQLYLDPERKILYAVNECGEQRGEIGGGGYLMAFKIDEHCGRLTLMNEKKSLSPEPSYLAMDQTKKYILACHCADPFHVTKVLRREDGTYFNQVLFDDTGLCMFKINEDGSIGEACDVIITKGMDEGSREGQVNIDPVSGHIQLVEVISRLHSVVKSPLGNVFAVCDKGMDRIYTYRINYARECLEKLDQWKSEKKACFPRYGVFHPKLPVYYANNENSPTINVFQYGENDGKLTFINETELLADDPGLIDGKPVGAQDILISPDGKNLYCTLCGLNVIIAMALDAQGRPEVIQRIKSGGVMPRGIQLSPDGRYLLAGNMISGNVTVFEVEGGGRLKEEPKSFAAVSPSAIRFLYCEG
ncbi:MAG: beta-propeller fold lactonase family protein [Clostridiales bacterium]|nr:beta-propeller fold lactonase family protein [Clostridiales bacterium]